MRQSLRIALRNTMRQRKRSMLLGGAIAFGIMIITLLNGFTGGITATIKSNFSDLFGGHIYIQGMEVTDSGRIIGRIKSNTVLQEALTSVDGLVEKVNKRSRSISEVIFGPKKVTQRIEGVNWDDETEFLEALEIAEGSLDGLDNPQALILPAKAAEDLGVEVGEQLILRLSTVTGQQNVGDALLIATTVDTGTVALTSGYMSLDYHNSLLNLGPEEYQIFNIYLRDIEQIETASKILYDELDRIAQVEKRENLDGASGERNQRPGPAGAGRRLMMGTFGGGNETTSWEGTKYAVTTLNDLLEQLVSMIQVLNSVGLGVYIILLIITMVGIMNTFRMVLLERTREIGTMRALGMTGAGVKNSFLMEAFFITLGGAVTGIAAALIIMGIVSRINFSTIPALQFFLAEGRLSFTIRSWNMLLNFVILSGMSLLAAFLPARAAARLRPVEALRAQY